MQPVKTVALAFIIRPGPSTHHVNEQRQILMSGVQFEKRVSEKQNQIECGFKSPKSLYQAATIESNDDDEIQASSCKRVKA